MAGGSIARARLQASLSRVLGNALLGKRCAVFSADLRIRSTASQFSSYPDLSIIWGRNESLPDDARSVINPTVIVEVLSDSTEAYDRGEKFGHYRHILSLQEYLLVSQTEPRLELFRKQNGRWVLYEAGPGETLKLESVEASLNVDEIYADPLAEPSILP